MKAPDTALERILATTQRLSDRIQDATGATCFLRAAVLAGAMLALLGTSAAATLLQGTVSYSRWTMTLTVLGTIATTRCALFPPVPHDRAWRPDGWQRALLFSSLATMITSLVTLAWWWTTIPTAATGDLPLQVVTSLASIELPYVLRKLHQDRGFRRACERGQIAPQSHPAKAITIAVAIDLATCAGLLLNLAVHGVSIATGTAGLSGVTFIAASLVGKCTPRPPRTKTRKQRLPLCLPQGT